MDDQTSVDQDRLKDLLDQLEWLKRYGLIDSYSVSPADDAGEIVLSDATAVLVRAGRQPITENGFVIAARSGPEAARRWLAREADSLRSRPPDRPE